MPTAAFDLKRYLTKLAAGEIVAAPSGSSLQKMIAYNRLGSRRAIKAEADPVPVPRPVSPTKPNTGYFKQLGQAEPINQTKKLAGFEVHAPVAWTPPISPELARRRKRRKEPLHPRTDQFLTSVGLTAGLGGLGAYAAGKSMLTDGARANLQSFSDAAKKWENMDPRLVTREYAAKGHEAVNQKVWGVPVGKAVGAVRSLFDNRWMPGQSSAHYQAFMSSPGSAHSKLLEEPLMSPEHVNLVSTLRAGKGHDLLNAQRTVSGVSPSGYGPPDAGLASLLTDIGAEPGKPVPLAAADARFQPRFEALRQEHLKLHGGEAAAGLDEFIKQKDPEVWKAKQVLEYAKGREIVGRGGSAGAYSAAINAGLKTQDTLKTWGKRVGLAGAGVFGAGVLLALLRNALAERRRKREEEEDAV